MNDKDFTLEQLTYIHKEANERYGYPINLIFDAGVPFLEVNIGDKTSQRKVADFDWVRERCQ